MTTPKKTTKKETPAKKKAPVKAAPVVTEEVAPVEEVEVVAQPEEVVAEVPTEVPFPCHACIAGLVTETNRHYGLGDPGAPLYIIANPDTNEVLSATIAEGGIPDNWLRIPIRSAAEAQYSEREINALVAQQLGLA